MNLKNFLIILFVIPTFTLISNINLSDDLQPKNEKEFCWCYCSDKCGPRKNNKPGDAPFIDKETGVCFCKLRDKLNYFPNGCNLKPKSDKINCCKQLENEENL